MTAASAGALSSGSGSDESGAPITDMLRPALLAAAAALAAAAKRAPTFSPPPFFSRILSAKIFCRTIAAMRFVLVLSFPPLPLSDAS